MARREERAYREYVSASNAASPGVPNAAAALGWRRDAPPGNYVTNHCYRTLAKPLTMRQFSRPATPLAGAPRPRAGAGGSVPPSARIFMFASAVLNCVTLRALSASRAALSASIELSKNRV